MSWIFIAFIALVFYVLAPLATAFAGRLSRDGKAASLPGVPDEMARLREEVDRLGSEVARLSEEQAFMVRLLASGEQKQEPGGPPAGQHPAA